MARYRRYFVQLLGMVKLFIAWVCLKLFYRSLYSENIWLISEKRNEARDNGYHFFRYLRENHKEVNAYYVITRDSVDMRKIEPYGNIIISDSFKHCLYYLAAKLSISSQYRGAYPFPLNEKEAKVVMKFCCKGQKTVFLQHGIIKDELSHTVFDYSVGFCDLFVCSAGREYDFVKKEYGYPSGAIADIGLCRFDNLFRNASKTERIMLVMPTFRHWLVRQRDGIPLLEEEKEKFQSSEYYQQYYSLLTDRDLKRKLTEKGYKLIFYMHYQFQDYTELFEKCADDNVIIADRFHFDVQDLLMRSSLLVTDFSSIAFDFAFMNKPLLYFQFDQERFFKEHYAKGYFDYVDDGFGPCCETFIDLKREALHLLDSGGCQPEKYSRRVEDFFSHRDANNCERTYEAVLNLQKCHPTRLYSLIEK